LVIMNKIKLLRMTNGVKQSELAEYLKVGQSTLSNWESGTFEPDIKSLRGIARFFGVTLDDVVGDSNDPVLLPEKKGKNSQTEYAHMIDTSGLSEEDRRDLDNYIELLKFRAMAKQRGEKAAAGAPPAAYAN